MADYTPKYFPGDRIGFTAGTGGVTGGLLVNFAGATAGAGDAVAGVAGYDAVAGATFALYRAGVHRLTAGATITVGQPLKAGAAGKAVPWVGGTDAANLYMGDALSAAASNASVDVALRIG